MQFLLFQNKKSKNSNPFMPCFLRSVPIPLPLSRKKFKTFLTISKLASFTLNSTKSWRECILQEREAQNRCPHWLEVFTNTKKSYSVSELAEFYANYVVTNGVVTSTVDCHKLRFDANDLGELLGVLVESFDMHIRKDKSILGDRGEQKKLKPKNLTEKSKNRTEKAINRMKFS